MMEAGDLELIISRQWSEAMDMLPEKSLEQEVSEQLVSDLAAYLELIKRWNSRVDLVSPQPDEMLVSRHIIDSLVIAEWQKAILKPESDLSFVDVGSGAGLPGIVLGVLERQRKVYLVEPREKRCVFLREVKRKLGLDNIEVCNQRIENFKPASRVGLCIARALGQRDLLYAQALRLCGSGGIVVDLSSSETSEGPQNKPLIAEFSYFLPPDRALRSIRAWAL